MLKKNEKNKFYKLALMLFIMLGLTIGSTFVAAHDTVVDPGYDKNVIGNNITDVTGNAWATISVVVMTLAIGCIVVTGLRYMLSSSDRKADIKQSSAYIVIGCVLIFATMPIINLVTNTFKDVTGAHVTYDSPNQEFKGENIEKATITSETVRDQAFANSTVKTVIFEEGIIEIGDNAFRNCKNLEEIILPSTIKVIGTSAFEGCTNVKRIIIRSKTKVEEVTYSGISYNVPGVEIKNRAFFGCKKVEKFGVGNYIYFSSIGENAFEECDKLSGFYIINGTAITDNYATLAFSGKLTLDMQGKAQNIGEIKNNAFNGTKITNLIVKTLNSNAITNDQSGSVENTKTHLKIGKVNAADVKEIFIAEGSKVTFEANSFENNDKLTLINIDENSEGIYFGEKAFAGCNSLGTITIGNNAGDISFGTNSFNISPTDILTQINVTIGNASEKNKEIYFGNSAFAGSLVNQVSIGSNYDINIDNDAFKASAIKEFSVDGNSDNVIFGQSSFAECKVLTDLVIGEVSKNITFDNWSFSGCTSLSRVEIPEGNEKVYIWDEAFKDATSLQKFVIPFEQDADANAINYSKVSQIGEGAFENCTNLEEFGKLKNKATGVYLDLDIISDRAFNGCEKLKSIRIYSPGKTIDIGDYAFKGCKAMNGASLPAYNTKLGNIGIEAFLDSGFDGNTYLYGTSIGERAFLNTQVKNVSLNAGEVDFNIGVSAFQKTPIETLTPSERMVLNIQSHAFYGCEKLKKIVAIFEIIGEGAFKDCTGLTYAELEASGTGNKTIITNAFANSFSDSADETQLVLKYNITVSENAFDSANMKKVVFEAKGESKIEKAAFINCKNMEDVQIKTTNAADVLNIETIAFSGAFKDNASLVLNGNINIEHGAFSDTTIVEKYESTYFSAAKLGSLKFTVTGNNKISNDVFRNCTKLTNVRITTQNNGTLTIMNNAFTNAFTSSGSLVLNGKINIGEKAFYQTNVKSVEATTLGYSIGNQAFAESSNLTSVKLINPINVTDINEKAFYNCKKLEEFNITSDNKVTPTISNIGKNAFALPNNIVESEKVQFTFSKAKCNTISEYAFNGRKIADIDIVASDNTTIGGYAFANTIGGDISVTSGSKVTVNSNAFNNATIGLLKLASGNININSNAFLNTLSAGTNLGQGDISLRGTITISSQAFNNADINNIIVYSNTQFEPIPKHAFLNCGLTGFVNENYADTFIKCNEIESGAFEGAKWMTALYVSSINVNDIVKIGNANSEDIEASISIDLAANNLFGDVTQNKYKLATVKFKGNVVLGIGAFAHMNSITSLEFENYDRNKNQIDVYNKAFYNCGQLAKVNLNMKQNGNGVYFKTIGTEAFRGTAVASIPLYLRNGATIGRYAFWDTALTSITLTAEAEALGIEIREGAFAGGTNLNNVIFAQMGETSGTSDKPTFAFKNINNEKAYAAISTNQNLTITIKDYVYVDFGKTSVVGSGSNTLKVLEYGSATRYGASSTHPSFQDWGKIDYRDNP